MDQISLNELPKYTGWPGILLGFEKYDIKYKNEKEILREFQDEKWGRLLNEARLLSNPTLHDIEKVFSDFSDDLFPYYEAGNFYLATRQQLLHKHLDLYAEILRPHLKGASCLVELGAGYGSKLFGLVQREEFSKLSLIAGEYTQSGRELISILAEALNKPVTVGHCDFWKLKIDNVTIPEDAIIFTSYAVHYVPDLSMDFVEFLSRLNPRAVVHFEPCYEHYTMDTLHGMMCRRYVELNDYTRNLVSVIESGRNRKQISVRIRKNILGSNPFLPISIIEWAPTGRSEILV